MTKLGSDHLTDILEDDIRDNKDNNRWSSCTCSVIVLTRLQQGTVSKTESLNAFKITPICCDPGDHSLDPGFQDALLVLHGSDGAYLVPHSILQRCNVSKSHSSQVCFKSPKKPKIVGG